MNELVCGFDTKMSSYRVYDNCGWYVMADGTPAPEEFLDDFVSYMLDERDACMEFYFYDIDIDLIYCQGRLTKQGTEGFIAGYGKSDSQAFTKCLQALDRLVLSRCATI